MRKEEKEKRIEITETWIKKFETKKALLDYEIQAINSMLFTLESDLTELKKTEVENE